MMAAMTAVVAAVMTAVITAVMTAGVTAPRTPPKVYWEGENYHKSSKRRSENPEMYLLQTQRLMILS